MCNEYPEIKFLITMDLDNFTEEIQGLQDNSVIIFYKEEFTAKKDPTKSVWNPELSEDSMFEFFEKNFLQFVDIYAIATERFYTKHTESVAIIMFPQHVDLLGSSKQVLYVKNRFKKIATFLEMHPKKMRFALAKHDEI
jgi:hypothetical protein